MAEIRKDRELQRYAAKSTKMFYGAGFHRVRTGLLLLAPPPLQKAPLAARGASGARRVTVGLVVAVLPVPLLTRGAARRPDAALDRARRRPHRRAVIVRVRVRGAGAGREKGVRRRARVAPRPRAGGARVRARVPGCAGPRGVLADAVLQVRAGGAVGAEEVEGAARGDVVGGADDGQGVAEDVADVEVARRVGLEDRAVGVRLPVGAQVGDADLAVEAGAEVGAAGRGAGAGAAVEGVVGVLGVAGPGDGEAVGVAVAGTVGDGEDAEGAG